MFDHTVICGILFLLMCDFGQLKTIHKNMEEYCPWTTTKTELVSVALELSIDEISIYYSLLII